ncbi:hypothetical protein RhiirA4_462201 [Rhizophagus irregularis]|uniref:Uncharacterized protein n=1 Tax=Rhizophagus irregularis TaxID=588596 RepID=A0A2I1GKF0_9GLOM|nr:hypothetical protein RhiirA4_462201 [Rhizophagus irregularis]
MRHNHSAVLIRISGAVLIICIADLEGDIIVLYRLVKPKSVHKGGRKRSNKNNNHNNEVNKDNDNDNVHKETIAKIINEYSVIVHKNDDLYSSVENSLKYLISNYEIIPEDKRLPYKHYELELEQLMTFKEILPFLLIFLEKLEAVDELKIGYYTRDDLIVFWQTYYQKAFSVFNEFETYLKTIRTWGAQLSVDSEPLSRKENGVSYANLSAYVEIIIRLAIDKLYKELSRQNAKRQPEKRVYVEDEINNFNLLDNISIKRAKRCSQNDSKK